MKTFKLKMEDFISNELVNQITISGGGEDPNDPFLGWPRVIGGGGGGVDPKGGGINDPSNM